MTLRFALDPDLTPDLRDWIVDLWVDVSNAGGAVGFVAPTTAEQVRPAAECTFTDVTEGPDRLLVGYEDERPVAFLVLTDNRFELARHWGQVTRVMVDPKTQGRGYGLALMREAARRAPELGWRSLRLSLRGGQGLERFYGKVGFREVGRLPRAVRVAPDDHRDEVIMWLDLAAADY